jgi:DNA-binding Lrp family transcriptional regulator
VTGALTDPWRGVLAYLEAEPGEWSVAALAEEFAATPAEVREMLREIDDHGYDVVLAPEPKPTAGRGRGYRTQQHAERVAAVPQLVAEGFNAEEIASHLGVTVPKAREFMREAGVAPVRVPAMERVAVHVSEHRGVCSFAELAEMFGCSVRLVREAVKRHGLGDAVRR